MLIEQENVWDFPRPAICEVFAGSLEVEVSGHVLAKTGNGFRSLETSHPPSYYIPPKDISMEFLSTNQRVTLCEWKGQASYFDLKLGDKIITDVAWTYTNPTPDFKKIKGYLSFYASKVDTCYVNGEKVLAQEGGCYGGWITNNLVGPFKGAKGTAGW